MAINSPVPAAFITRKDAILASLAAPNDTYTDLSPKGSVDEAIRPLIDKINRLEGIVTTSSCAGRVSVFLEGSKTASQSNAGSSKEGDEEPERRTQNAVPGGKGLGGRWLFVSHKPCVFDGNQIQSSLAATFGMSPYVQENNNVDFKKAQIARFQFEPMILHIMCASLQHARPILAAAINAGFRESGVQSLKNLDDANAFPMVAIRSSGLALESVVGWAADGITALGEAVRSLVSENYLGLLFELAAGRFKTNAERIMRLEDNLFRRGTEDRKWEDVKERHERKRAEGLRQRETMRKQ